MLRVVRWAEAPEVPWRNGGGTTRELHVEGGEPFDWRLSAATIAADGPFSSFPGIDRILVLLRGEGVRLRFADNGSTAVLDRSGAAAAFAGERPVHAALLGATTLDLNLMWRRDAFDATLHDDCRAGVADITVVHVVAGEAAVVPAGAGAAVVLGTGDSAWWEAGEASLDDAGGTAVCFGLVRRTGLRR